jgi:hypothetical protein
LSGNLVSRMCALSLPNLIFTEPPGVILALTGTGTISRGLSCSSNSAMFPRTAGGNSFW